MRGATGHTQPKVLVYDATLSWWLTPCIKKIRHRFIPFGDVVDQRFFQSDWMRGTLGHIKSKMVILGVTFLWWYSPGKRSNISI